MKQESLLTTELRKHRDSWQGICEVCGEYIFHLDTRQPNTRVWWHETVNTDFHHEAVPKIMAKDIDIV